MWVNNLLTSVIYLAASFVVFLIGKVAYSLFNRKFNLRDQLFEKDNFAVALAVAGYFLGLVFSIGGVILGPTHGLTEDLIDIFFYGIITIILLNISAIINDKLILYKFNNEKEIIVDRNAGTGIVVAASYIAVGLNIWGAVSGQGGDLVTALVFWALGQLTLIAGGFFYNWILPFDIHHEIEKDNVAVGVAFAGVLIALGIIAKAGSTGDFISWEENLPRFGADVALGLLLLPVMRFSVGKILLPGANFTKEQTQQEVPNIGAGAMEALSYISAALLVGWVL